MRIYQTSNRVANWLTEKGYESYPTSDLADLICEVIDDEIFLLNGDKLYSIPFKWNKLINALEMLAENDGLTLRKVSEEMTICSKDFGEWDDERLEGIYTFTVKLNILDEKIDYSVNGKVIISDDENWDRFIENVSPSEGYYLAEDGLNYVLDYIEVEELAL